MIFNSVAFFCFFIVFYFLYWFITNRNLKAQNLLILIASYFFYAWSDWRFLSYLIGSTLLNYILGIYIEKSANPGHKKLLLYIGLIQGIGGLVFFKYFNFFIASFNDAFHFFGLNLDLRLLRIIIPLGISFFTFRTISYLLDINKGKIKASRDWIVFFTYVAYFPSLVSGPIDRANNLIPQLEKKRILSKDQSVDGLNQILWGFFKKIVVADNCSSYVSQIFHGYQTLPSSMLLLGAFLYAIQIYADFSGYTDMAIGFSNLIGLRITRNFSFPFFAQNIAEYWRKWHISLTSWLTEYVFTPLSISFRDYGNFGLMLAIIINFTLCGIWHGANWTYVLFGFLHGCYFIPLILRGTMNKKKKISHDKLLPSLKEFLNMLGTFTLVMLTLVIFRADSIVMAFQYLVRLFSPTLFTIPEMHLNPLLFILIMFVVEWLQRDKEFGLQINGIKRPAFKLLIYYGVLFTILVWGNFGVKEFIYAQF
jgi:alginate O-acetyltransferase complex protein AlgI